MWFTALPLFAFLIGSIFCQEYRVKDFGAVGDGITYDTVAVRAALYAAANSNGGRVIFDSGFKFLTGPFNITSNVILDVQGMIIGSPNRSDYYPIQQDPWFLDWYPTQMHSLILSYKAKNITITGGGMINGQSEYWNGTVGPFTLKLLYTNDSTVEDITIFNCPRWTLVLGYATNIHINRVNITNPTGYFPQGSDGISNDGYDIVCSVNVTLENSYYKGGDDGVMIKSGRNGPALLYGRASENILVRNMILEASGGIGAGVEITAGVRNVTYENITLIGAMRGINVQSQRGMGGFIEDMTFRNIRMINVNATLIFSMWYFYTNITTNTPKFKNFLLENITIDNSAMEPTDFAHEWVLNGAEESPIEGFVVRNMQINSNLVYVKKCYETVGTCSNVTPFCPPCLKEEATEKCPNGWKYFQGTDSCYKKIFNCAFEDCENNCQNMGAHLTSIHSKAENKFVNDFAASGQLQWNFNQTTIGIHMIDGNWIWTDGTPFDYNNWALGQPDYNGGKQRCGLTYADFPTQNAWNLIHYSWDNVECEIPTRAAVCKMPSSIISTTTSTTESTTIKVSTTTKTTKKPLTTCAGAIDLVFVIDASDTMTKARFDVLKNQLASAITQANITWGDNNAHVGIVLSTGLNPGWKTTPYRYLDLNGCQYYAWNCTPTISSTYALVTAVKDMPFYGGKNNLFLSMNETLSGEYNGIPDSYVIFGDPYWGRIGDRSDVSDVMIVISGNDTSDVTPATNALIANGVTIYSIGFSDLPINQLQKISGDPSRSFTTTPENLANVIKNICLFK